MLNEAAHRNGPLHLLRDNNTLRTCSNGMVDASTEDAVEDWFIDRTWHLEASSDRLKHSVVSVGWSADGSRAITGS